MNFAKEDQDFFAQTIARWRKMMHAVQHLPHSMARMDVVLIGEGRILGGRRELRARRGRRGQGLFFSYVGRGRGGEGVEFKGEPRTDLERRCRLILEEELNNAKTAAEKDELTFWYVFNDR